MEDSKYFVYMLLCNDKTFYTGTSNNVQKRVATHNSGKGAKYTKVRRPVKLMYSEELKNKSEALKREIALATWLTEPIPTIRPFFLGASYKIKTYINIVNYVKIIKIM